MVCFVFSPPPCCRQAPGTPQTVRLATPTQTRMIQPPSTTAAVQVCFLLAARHVTPDGYFKPLFHQSLMFH